MDYRKLAYDDAAPLREMAADCRAVDRQLHRGTHRPLHHRVASEPAPADLATPRVSPELADRAARLELHLG